MKQTQLANDSSSRRAFLTASLVVASAIAISFGSYHSPAQAQTWPEKIVRIVNPYSAGGPADQLGREVAKHLSDLLGQQFIVENKPGAGTALGAEYVVRSDPDGYTLLLSTAASHMVTPALRPDETKYDGLSSFAPAAIFAVVPNILAVHPSVPAKTVSELIALAKKDPGKLNYASAGNGSSPHLAAEIFNSMTGISVTHIPYKGAAPAVVDLVGGNVQMALLNISAVLPQVKAGKLRALAIASDKRSPALPDVPTMAEAGVADFESGSWYGLSAPAKTPKPVLETIYEALTKVVNSAEMQQKLAAQGAEGMLLGPDKARSFMQADKKRIDEVIKSANIKTN